MKLPSIKAYEEPAAPEAQVRAFVEMLPEAPAPVELPRSPIGYLGALWRGEVPLSRALWRDMVLVGTLVNVAAMSLAFAAVALGASTMTGIAIHLSTAPYNIFLVAAVWKCAERARADQAWAARFGSLAWLLIAFVI